MPRTMRHATMPEIDRLVRPHLDPLPASPAALREEPVAPVVALPLEVPAGDS